MTNFHWGWGGGGLRRGDYTKSKYLLAVSTVGGATASSGSSRKRRSGLLESFDVGRTSTSACLWQYGWPCHAVDWQGVVYLAQEVRIAGATRNGTTLVPVRAQWFRDQRKGSRLLSNTTVWQAARHLKPGCCDGAWARSGGAD